VSVASESDRCGELGTQSPGTSASRRSSSRLGAVSAPQALRKRPEAGGTGQPSGSSVAPGGDIDARWIIPPNPINNGSLGGAGLSSAREFVDLVWRSRSPGPELILIGTRGRRDQDVGRGEYVADANLIRLTFDRGGTYEFTPASPDSDFYPRGEHPQNWQAGARGIFHGEYRDKLHSLRSAAKSLTSVLVGAGIRCSDRPVERKRIYKPSRRIEGRKPG
jgi:hypothetical protein